MWDPPEREEQLRRPYERNLAAWQDGSAYCFTIESRENGDFLGRITIRREDGDAWGVGYWTSPAHQGQGFATEALRRVVEFGFRELGARRLSACYVVWNEASRRVLEKTGFRFSRHILEGFQKRGEWVAENEMVLTRQEWENGADHLRSAHTRR